ncbi:SWIM zinc finger family protein [Streptomyces sp. NPDC053560]|uniref:SWIM zinc finger family protein n=1 Tax=Streptomyces sp. NPDC053560 TaxID=3365711 RepID=UPI0037D16F64
MTGHDHDEHGQRDVHGQYGEHVQYDADGQYGAHEEESASVAMGEGLEKVRRELERGRAMARAREAAAEAIRAREADGRPGPDEDAALEADGAACEEDGTGRGAGEPHAGDDRTPQSDLVDPAHAADAAGESGSGRAPGAGRRSEAAERARRAVRRTGEGPRNSPAREAGEAGPNAEDEAGDGLSSAGTSGEAGTGRSRAAEEARQALKRAAPEARRAREEASRPPAREPQQDAEAAENGAEQKAVRRSAAAERARQAVARPGRTRTRPDEDRGHEERGYEDRGREERGHGERSGADSAGANPSADRRPGTSEDRRPGTEEQEQQSFGTEDTRSTKGSRPAAANAKGHLDAPHAEAIRSEASRSEVSRFEEASKSARRAPRSAPKLAQAGLRRVGDALGGASEGEGKDEGERGAASAAEEEAAAAGRVAGRARVFPAVAVGGADGEEFAETWWGRAWLDALESTALDTARLARGRDYASGGHVGRITVAPGRISAPVTGSRPYPYRAELRLRPFPDAVWEAFLDDVAARPAHLAALLGRTLPRALAEREEEAGVRLLPGPGDLVPRCSCPDRGHPCKHAAALCFQAARLLDADPFVLLLMRGRGERELLDELSRRNATHSAGTERAARATLPAVPARAALHARELPPLPPPLSVPEHTGRPPVLPTADDPAIDPAAVELLAADAAARARACLAAAQAAVAAPRQTGIASREDALSPFPARTLWEDAIRLVAGAHPTSGLTASTREIYRGVAEATGRPVNEVARAVAAWRQGGSEGLDLLESTWEPPAGDFDRARSALSAADLPTLRPRHNHLTDADRGIQLRFGRDGRWYPYESDPGTEDWWPTGRADADPVGALTPAAGDGIGGLSAPGWPVRSPRVCPFPMDLPPTRCT